MKKIISGILATSLMLSMTAFATSNSDLPDDALLSIEDHWSEEYMLSMYDLGVILPTTTDGDGGKSFTPDSSINRAEFMRYVNRLFNHSDMTEIGFEDVLDTAWYYDDVSKAVANGYMQGDSPEKMRPTGFLTRQEAIVILSRLHKIEPSSASEVDFTDADDIADWALPYVADAVEKGYISGRANGEFDPEGYVTRGEIAKILYLLAGTVLDDAVSDDGDLQSDTNNVTIRANDDSITLRNAEVAGNLYISAGAVDTEVFIDNVNVKGQIIIFGNGVDVTLNDTICDEIIAAYDSQDIQTTGTTDILNLTVYADTVVEGDGIENVIDKTVDTNTDITLQGNYRDVVLSNDTNLHLLNADIAKLYVLSSAKGAEIDLENSYIDVADIRASSELFGGAVYEIIIVANDVTIDTTNSVYSVAAGYTARINGETISSAGNYTPEYSITIDQSKEVTEEDVDIDMVESDVLRVVYNNKTLTEETEYYFEGERIVFTEYFLGKLTSQTNKIDVTSKSDNDKVINIYYIDSSKHSISTTDIDYDVSLETGDLEFSLIPAEGEELNGITYGGYVDLRENTDYTTYGNKVYLRQTYLDTLAKGEATFTLNMSDGEDLKLVVNIIDNAPPNEISPVAVTFDRNIASELYDDIDVTLTESEGFLQGIFFNSTELRENIDYTVKGDVVSIKREFIIEEGLSSLDLKFNMSKGIDPVLEVSVIETYPVLVNVVDTDGKGIEGAIIDVRDEVYTTDKNGEVWINLDYGNHYTEITKNGYRDLSDRIYVSSTYSREITFTLN